MTTEKRLSAERIEEAGLHIDPVFSGTPQYEAETLGDELGLRLVCKVETVNPIRSFKGRGTDYLLYREGSRAERLVCASAGNFGQGLAYAARRRGVPLTVFAAESANPSKVDRMRALGAEVLLKGEDLDEAKAAAREYAASGGQRFIEDGREPEIAEGAGTIALELCRWPEAFDTIVVPLGNGALLSGVGVWVKAHSPSTRVIGVCSQGAPAMALSLQEGVARTTDKAETIADGIAVRVPVEEALSDLAGVVDDILLIDDESLTQSMRMLFRELGLVVEPAGAAGMAALLTHRDLFTGSLVATPLCGGNLTHEQARRWLLEDTG